ATSTTDTGTPTQTADVQQFVEVVNATSETEFGTQVLQRSGLLFSSQADALTLASLLERRYGSPLIHPSFTLSSTARVNVYQMLARGIWDRVTTQRQGQGGETQYSGDGLLEQITHRIDLEQPLWETDWSTSPYELIT
ncbi:MAG: hypothetical protein ACRD6W_05265, partial [Nitrososphaerales archaeon]